MPPQRKLNSLCHLLFMPPSKFLRQLSYCTPRVALKKEKLRRCPPTYFCGDSPPPVMQILPFWDVCSQAGRRARGLGGPEIEEFLANEEIEEMRDFLCFSSQEKKFLKNFTQTKKWNTFTLTKITYKKCVHFHVREEVREKFHANQEVEEIFSRKNKQHLVGVATFPKTLW